MKITDSKAAFTASICASVLLAASLLIPMQAVSGSIAANEFFSQFTSSPINGDVNGDGKITSADANEIKSYFLNDKVSEYSETDLDVNCDGNVKASDFVLLRQYVSKTNTEEIKNTADKKNIPYEFTDDYDEIDRILVFDEEFDGDSIDYTKWAHVRAASGGDSFYVNDESTVKVENGELVLTTYILTDEQKEAYGVENKYAKPECLTTKDKMLFRYGYAEIRAKLPFRHGAWPAWWLQTWSPYKKANYMAETDIFEVFSSTDTVTCTIHKWGDIHSSLVPRARDIPCDYVFYTDNLLNEYHTYGFLWTPETMGFYVDGEGYAAFRIDDSGEWEDQLPGMQGFHDYAFMLFDLELYSEGMWGASEKDYVLDEEMPMSMAIDYVRLYQCPTFEGIHNIEDITAEYEWTK